MNKGDSANREHWVQIITTIPEISSIDHSRNQTTDKKNIRCQIKGFLVLNIVLSSFDDPGKDHVMLGADGLWVLIGCSGTGHKVFSQITHRYNFIHQTAFCKRGRFSKVSMLIESFRLSTRIHKYGIVLLLDNL
jgi:hypothetical protein